MLSSTLIRLNNFKSKYQGIERQSPDERNEDFPDLNSNFQQKQISNPVVKSAPTSLSANTRHSKKSEHQAVSLSSSSSLLSFSSSKATCHTSSLPKYSTWSPVATHAFQSTSTFVPRTALKYPVAEIEATAAATHAYPTPTKYSEQAVVGAAQSSEIISLNYSNAPPGSSSSRDIFVHELQSVFNGIVGDDCGLESSCADDTKFLLNEFDVASDIIMAEMRRTAVFIEKSEGDSGGADNGNIDSCEDIVMAPISSGGFKCSKTRHKMIRVNSTSDFATACEMSSLQMSPDVITKTTTIKTATSKAYTNLFAPIQHTHTHNSSCEESEKANTNASTNQKYSDVIDLAPSQMPPLLETEISSIFYDEDVCLFPPIEDIFLSSRSWDSCKDSNDEIIRDNEEFDRLVSEEFGKVVSENNGFGSGNCDDGNNANSVGLNSRDNNDGSSISEINERKVVAVVPAQKMGKNKKSRGSSGESPMGSGRSGGPLPVKKKKRLPTDELAMSEAWERGSGGTGDVLAELDVGRTRRVAAVSAESRNRKLYERLAHGKNKNTKKGNG